MSKRSAIANALVALATAACFAYLAFVYTTDAANLKDGAQNTRGAYHLVHSGVLSIDEHETGNPKPQMRREPLPIWVTAAYLSLHPAFAQPYTLEDIQTGRLAETVKGVNALWRLLAAILIFLLCFELFTDKRLALVAGVLCNLASEFFFFSRSSIVDRMYTEMPEVTLMLLSAWCAVRFVRVQSRVRALGLGVALGLLALVKASFLYIGFGFVVLLWIADRTTHDRPIPKPSWGPALATYGVILVAMAITVAPWVARNLVLFGKPQIVTGTDASVLGTRMLLTQQTLLGQLYVYSPVRFKTNLVGPLTGYTLDDLKPGGRLEEASQTKANRSDIFRERMLQENYRGNPATWARSKAVDYAIDHPGRYLASIPVFAYKGMWFMTAAGAEFNLAAVLTFMGVFFGALFTRNQILLAAFGLPAGLFFFIAIFTHALTRYTAPMAPFVILACLWLSAQIALWAYRRFNLGRIFQSRSDASNSSQRPPTTPTSSVETASRA